MNTYFAKRKSRLIVSRSGDTEAVIYYIFENSMEVGLTMLKQSQGKK